MIVMAVPSVRGWRPEDPGMSSRISDTAAPAGKLDRLVLYEVVSCRSLRNGR
jgi:hypothetical protein